MTFQDVAPEDRSNNTAMLVAGWRAERDGTQKASPPKQSHPAIDPGVAKAVAFLEALDPTGRHNLVAFPLEGGEPQGRTFEAGEWDAMATWIAERADRLALYYSANEPAAGAPHAKLKKKHIGALRAVFVDLDPPGLAPLDEERDVLLALAGGTRFSPFPPSFEIDSGGGVQMLWRLQTKLEPIDHTQWAEDQGRALAVHFNGDAVQNIDRILRLPGVMNIPNAKKRAKGRGPRMASLLHSSGRTYTPEALSTVIAPVPAVERGDRSEGIRVVQAELESAALGTAASFGDLDQDLRDRFAAACERNGRLRRLWHDGDRTALVGSDASGSGFRWSLAAYLHRAGGFAPSDFGELLYVWDHAGAAGDTIDETLTARTIARDWVRSARPSDAEIAQEWFDGVSEQSLPGKRPDGGVSDPPPLRAGRVAVDDLIDLPPREWLYGYKVSRRYVMMLVSPGGVGKTAYTYALGLAAASGRQLLHDKPHRRIRVWLYNLEDDIIELRRRLAAAMKHYQLGAEVLEDIRLNSGRDRRFLIVRTGQDGAFVVQPDHTAIIAEMKRERIDLLIVDPFLRSHGVPENGNEAQDEVMRLYGEIAQEANAGIILVHHTKKGAVAGDMDSARGGSTQMTGARSGYTLAAASVEEAVKLGIPEQERRRFVRIDDGKSNMAPPASATEWMKLESVSLANGNADYPQGDSVQVAVKWDPPSAWDGVTQNSEDAALLRIHLGPGDGERYSIRPQDRDRWAGRMLIEQFGRTDAQARGMLDAWRKGDRCEVREYYSVRQKKMRQGIVVKDPPQEIADDIFA